MENYKRNALFTPLKKYCAFAKEDSFMEVTEWRNGEGFDVEVGSPLPTRFQLTYGEFDALKRLVKKLEKWKKK